MTWDRPGPGECLCGAAHPCAAHGRWAGVHVQSPGRIPAPEGFSGEDLARLRRVGWLLLQAMADDRREREAARGAA